jgi:hypothetical protein
VRNLSFALTTRQMRDRTKTVTRRRGTYWARVLRPGDLVCAVEKSQGIKSGGLVRLGVIRVVSVYTELLGQIRFERDGCAREGFPGLLPEEFVEMFCRHMGGDHTQIVTRIEFEWPRCTCNHLDHDPRAFGCEFCPCRFVPAGEVRT